VKNLRFQKRRQGVCVFKQLLLRKSFPILSTLQQQVPKLNDLLTLQPNRWLYMSTLFLCFPST
jgi:hypothetical protein